MTQYWLPPNCFFCALEDGGIFLDIENHRYKGLAIHHCRALAETIVGWPYAPDDAGATGIEREHVAELLKRLQSRGLIVPTSSPGRSAQPLNAAVRAALDYSGKANERGRISLSHLTAFLPSVIESTWRMRYGSLSSLFRRLNSLADKHDLERRSEADPRDLVGIFRRIAVWFYTSKDACLFDSAALVLFLSKFSVRAHYVIGVRTKPFKAHCWAQHNGTVLNDTLERVSPYTQILIV